MTKHDAALTVADLLAAFKPIMLLCDRKTVEFDAAYAAIARAEGTDGTGEQRATSANVPSLQKIFCVRCFGEDGIDFMHVFSTMEVAQNYCAADEFRHHVIYDYVIDCPERMNGHVQ